MVSLSTNEIVLLQGLASYNDTRGTLYLTTQRLIFDYNQRVLFFKGNYNSLDLQITRISNSSVVGFGPFKKLAICLNKENNSFGLLRHEFKVDKPEKWIVEIEVARRKNANSSSTSYTKEITKEIIKIRCDYCGMLVEQHLARCPNCNAIQ